MLRAKKRINIICVIFIIGFLCLITRLFYMQVMCSTVFKELSENKTSTNVITKAPRGEITDRYGKLLAGNRSGYCLMFIKSELNFHEQNRAIIKVLNMLHGEETPFMDSMPVTVSDNQYLITAQNSKWLESYDVDNALNADAVMEFFCRRYGISGYDKYDSRRIAGFYYEADKHNFSYHVPFKVADDVPFGVVSRIEETPEEFSCFTVIKDYSRIYYNDGYASHIVGRVGKVSKDEYKLLKNKGYKIDDYCGKQGVEKLAEEFLRGTDGVVGTQSGDFSFISKKDAQQGNRVVLTIDFQMQKVIENSLAEHIKQISSYGGVKSGMDANSGAAVVVDINNGDVLACASYPTFRLDSFNKDYNLLSQNPDLPLWNRAVSGTYSPGSTFKPLVALAALESGSITTDEIIEDKGIYEYYEDYRPRCWIWSEQKNTHGNINVSEAIENSCNYFFYEAGRRTGINKIAAFGKSFGLGEYTGTGLEEEAKGRIACPESKSNVVKPSSDSTWFGADTLQAAIGQSIHAFTPLQMANYIAAIANGGYRYKLNLIKSIRSGKDGKVIKQNSPEIVEKISLDKNNLEAVRIGMKNVAEDGSARKIFAGYHVQIGGKTGTAQVGSNGSNNGLFVAFAPYDKPEIAVCVVLEHGVSGANAAYVAKDLFDYYFSDYKGEVLYAE